ncbi:hypothetical protein GF324_11335 [bacterium]|nr:hypothetical protein [bacterium]
MIEQLNPDPKPLRIPELPPEEAIPLQVRIILGVTGWPLEWFAEHIMMVSRATVYRWLNGSTVPSSRLERWHLYRLERIVLAAMFLNRGEEFLELLSYLRPER